MSALQEMLKTARRNVLSARDAGAADHACFAACAAAEARTVDARDAASAAAAATNADCASLRRDVATLMAERDEERNVSAEALETAEAEAADARKLAADVDAAKLDVDAAKLEALEAYGLLEHAEARSAKLEEVVERQWARIAELEQATGAGRSAVGDAPSPRADESGDEAATGRAAMLPRSRRGAVLGDVLGEVAPGPRDGADDGGGDDVAAAPQTDTPHGALLHETPKKKPRRRRKSRRLTTRKSGAAATDAGGQGDADDADDAGDSPRPSRTPNQKRREKRTLGRKRGNELLTVDGLFAMLMAAPIDGAKLLRTGWKNPTTLTGWSEACKGHTAESAAQLVYKFWGCGQSARDYFCDVIDRLHAAGKVVNVEAIAAEAGRPVDDGGLGDSSYAHYRRVIMGLLLVQLLERYGFSYSDVRFPNWDEFYKVALSCGRGHKRLKIGLRFLLGDAVRKDQVDLGEDVTQTVGMPFVDALRAAAEARHAATAAANND